MDLEISGAVLFTDLHKWTEARILQPALLSSAVRSTQFERHCLSSALLTPYALRHGPALQRYEVIAKDDPRPPVPLALKKRSSSSRKQRLPGCDEYPFCLYKIPKMEMRLAV